MTARAVEGLVGLDALLLALGLALLVGLGFVRSLRQAPRLAGLALFLGWAALGVAASLAAVAGASLVVWQLVALAAFLAVCGLALGRVVGAAPLAPRLRERGLATWAALGGAAVLVVFLADLFRRSRVEVTTAWDAHAFWIPKAAAIVLQGGVHAGDGRFTSLANPDYPLFAPVQDAISFRFVGSVDPAALPTQHWVIAVAFLAAAAGLLAGRVRPLLLWPGLALVALMPSFGDLVGSSLGDEPLALVLALAGLLAALWLLERDDRLLVLCGICTTAAALTKVEGLPAAILVAVLLLVATRAWRPLLPLLLVPILADLPWRFWMHRQHISSNSAFPYSKLLDPSFLAHRFDRLRIALSDLPQYLLSPNRWLLAVPVALALALLLARRRPALTLLVVGTAVLAFLGNAAIYWISPLEIHWYIDTSAARVASSTALVCALVAPLLLSEALGDDGDQSGGA